MVEQVNRAPAVFIVCTPISGSMAYHQVGYFTIRITTGVSPLSQLLCENSAIRVTLYEPA